MDNPLDRALAHCRQLAIDQIKSATMCQVGRVLAVFSSNGGANGAASDLGKGPNPGEGPKRLPRKPARRMKNAEGDRIRELFPVGTDLSDPDTIRRLEQTCRDMGLALCQAEGAIQYGTERANKQKQV